MKYYYVVGGRIGDHARMYYILQADVDYMVGEPEYVKPTNVKLFWYRNEKVKDAALKHIDSWHHVGWEKYMIGNDRELIKQIFRIPND